MKFAYLTTLLCIISFTFTITSIQALNIHTNSSSLFLDSQYSTIGSYPSKSHFYNITVVQADAYSNFKSYGHDIANQFVVFVGVPASVSLLALDAQKSGASGLIFKQLDNFRGGRAVAFKTPVTIPVVVAPGETIDAIVENAPFISSLELTAITSSEKGIVNRLKNEYSAVMILVIIIYAALTPFFAYLFVFEVLYAVKIKRRYFTHTCLMKLVALITAILWLLWCVVDPMGFKGKEHWNEAVVCFLAGGFLLALYLLILRILVIILSSTHFSSWHKLYISRILYFLSGFFIVLFILLSTVWLSPRVALFFKFFLCTSVIAIGILYTILGKLMLDTLTNGGNKGPKDTIVARLSAFIAYYGVASVVLLATVHIHFSNQIFTTIVCALLHSVGLLFTFVLLFVRYPSQLNRTHRNFKNSRQPSQPDLLQTSHSFSSDSMSPTTELGLSDSNSGLDSPRGPESPRSNPETPMLPPSVVNHHIQHHAPTYTNPEFPENVAPHTVEMVPIEIMTTIPDPVLINVQSARGSTGSARGTPPGL